MDATNSNQELTEYLRKRLEHLEQCNATFESHLDEERRGLQRKRDEGAVRHDDPEVRKINHHREYVVANTFRYTMLVGLCSFLEEAIREITQRLDSNYDANIKAKKGSWLRRHTQVLVAHSGVDLGPIRQDLSTFHDLITMRNCVVHAWGRVAGARNPKATKDAVARIDTAEIFKDGFLRFGDQVLPEAIIAAENIADHILVSELKTSIT